MRADAREVVDLSPDAIVVHSNPFVAALRQINRTIPTVFVQVCAGPTPRIFRSSSRRNISW
jgi:hypothetical protein